MPRRIPSRISTLLLLVVATVSVLGLALIAAPRTARSQESHTAGVPATIDNSIEAAESETPLPPKDQKLMHWSDYVSEDLLFHFGWNLMYDGVG